MVLFSDFFSVAHGDGGLNDHDRPGIYFQDELYDRLHGGTVKEIFLAVIVCGRRNHNKVGFPVCRLAVQSGSQIQIFLGQVFFNIFILYGRFSLIDKPHFFRQDVYGQNVVVLGQQRGDGEPHIPGAGHGDGICFLQHGRRGLLVGFLLHEEVGHFEIKDFSQSLELFDGGNIISVFRAADHGPVDTGGPGQLCLGHFFCFSPGYEGGRQCFFR